MLRIRGKAAISTNEVRRQVGEEGCPAGPATSEDDSVRIESESSRDPIGSKQSKSGRLESFVLGGEEEFWKKLDANEHGRQSEPNDDSAEKEVEASPGGDKELKKPVWEDDDDTLLIEVPRKRKLADIVETIDQQDGKVAAQDYADRLKKRFERTANVNSSVTPAWADLNKGKRRKKKSTSDTESGSDDDDDLINDLTRRTGCYVGDDVNLPKSVLQFKKHRDVTSGYRIKAIVNSVEFHKQAQVLLVAGYTQRIQIYQIDGKDNPMLQSITLEGFPIQTAHFSSDGGKVYAGSELHEYFYYYDLMSGKAVKVPQIRSLNFMRMANFVVSPDGKLLAFRGPYGNIHLLSSKTHECICTLKMNGAVNGLDFSSNGSALYSHGDDGEVYVWDVTNRVCVHRFYDEGCVKGLCITSSPDDRYLATGSNTGVVNVYDMDAVRNSTAPKPIKAIMNLTTSVKALRFNPTSEVLAFASAVKPKQLKLFHARSRTTFSNFPSLQDNISLVQSMDFSTNSGYMCVSCENGRASMYRLLHYGDY